MTTDAKAVYTSSLTATHAAETQGLTMIETQLKGMTGYPEYRTLLEDSARVTRTQIDRIEAALEETGTSRNAIKEAVTNLVGAGGAAIHQMFPDTQLKNLFAGYAYQYHQAAAYKSLAVLAEAGGYSQHTGWIQTCHREEEQGADAAEALVETVTRQYLAAQIAGA